MNLYLNDLHTNKFIILPTYTTLPVAGSIDLLINSTAFARISFDKDCKVLCRLLICHKWSKISKQHKQDQVQKQKNAYVLWWPRFYYTMLQTDIDDVLVQAKCLFVSLPNNCYSTYTTTWTAFTLKTSLRILVPSICVENQWLCNILISVRPSTSFSADTDFLLLPDIDTIPICVGSECDTDRKWLKEERWLMPLQWMTAASASGIITSPACPLSTSRGRGRSGSHTHIIGINRQGRPPQESWLCNH